MKLLKFFDVCSSVMIDGDHVVIGNEKSSYWNVQDNSVGLIRSLSCIPIYPRKVLGRNLMYFYDKENNYCEVVEGKGECKAQFPNELGLYKGWNKWNYSNGVWVNRKGRGSKREIIVYDPKTKTLLSKKALDIYYASEQGCVLYEHDGIVKRNMEDELLWKVDGVGEHRLIGQWHEKGLLIFLLKKELVLKAIDIDSGAIVFSLPVQSKSVRMDAKGDVAAVLEEGGLHAIVNKDGTIKVDFKEHSKSIGVDDIVVAGEYIIYASKCADLFIHRLVDLSLVNTIDMKSIAAEVSQLTWNIDMVFLRVSGKDKLAEEGISKIIRADVHELVSSSEAQVEEEFLSCQNFIPEPDPIKLGVRIRLVPEVDIDIDTLCRHLPIGMYRAAFENATCIGPGYVEGKYELPDFNGTIFVDFGDRELDNCDIELLSAYIDAVHERFKWGGYGTPDKKQLARVVTNYPGLFNEQ